MTTPFWTVTVRAAAAGAAPGVGKQEVRTRAAPAARQASSAPLNQAYRPLSRIADRPVSSWRRGRRKLVACRGRLLAVLECAVDRRRGRWPPVGSVTPWFFMQAVNFWNCGLFGAAPGRRVPNPCGATLRHAANAAGTSGSPPSGPTFGAVHHSEVSRSVERPSLRPPSLRRSPRSRPASSCTPRTSGRRPRCCVRLSPSASLWWSLSASTRLPHSGPRGARPSRSRSRRGLRSRQTSNHSIGQAV